METEMLDNPEWERRCSTHAGVPYVEHTAEQLLEDDIDETLPTDDWEMFLPDVVQDKLRDHRSNNPTIVARTQARELQRYLVLSPAVLARTLSMADDVKIRRVLSSLPEDKKAEVLERLKNPDPAVGPVTKLRAALDQYRQDLGRARQRGDDTGDIELKIDAEEKELAAAKESQTERILRSRGGPIPCSVEGRYMCPACEAEGNSQDVFRPAVPGEGACLDKQCYSLSLLRKLFQEDANYNWENLGIRGVTAVDKQKVRDGRLRLLPVNRAKLEWEELARIAETPAPQGSECGGKREEKLPDCLRKGPHGLDNEKKCEEVEGCSWCSKSRLCLSPNLWFVNGCYACRTEKETLLFLTKTFLSFLHPEGRNPSVPYEHLEPWRITYLRQLGGTTFLGPLVVDWNPGVSDDGFLYEFARYLWTMLQLPDSRLVVVRESLSLVKTPPKARKRSFRVRVNKAVFCEAQTKANVCNTSVDNMEKLLEISRTQRVRITDDTLKQVTEVMNELIQSLGSSKWPRYAKRALNRALRKARGRVLELLLEYASGLKEVISSYEIGSLLRLLVLRSVARGARPAGLDDLKILLASVVRHPGFVPPTAPTEYHTLIGGAILRQF